MNPFDSSTNTGRFCLLGIIVFDSFAAGAAFRDQDYSSTTLGAILVTAACFVLGGFLYKRGE